MRRVQLITACGARHDIRDVEYDDNYIELPLIADREYREIRPIRSSYEETPATIGRRRFKHDGEIETRDRQPIYVYREVTAL